MLSQDLKTGTLKTVGKSSPLKNLQGHIVIFPWVRPLIGTSLLVASFNLVNDATFVLEMIERSDFQN